MNAALTICSSRIQTSHPELTYCEVQPNYGSATSALRVTLPDGSSVPIFTERDDETLAALKSDPNAPFKLWNSPLFPMTNRLRGATSQMGVIEAEVGGIPVRMPLNHLPGERGECHLHGLLYARTPSEEPEQEPSGAPEIRTRYRDFFNGFWTGSCSVEIRHALRDGSFHYTIRATNTGTTPMPAGFGSHPYFEAPGGDANALRLLVPARSYAEINNLEEVFPSGRLNSVEGSQLDYATAPKAFATRFLDNYWTDLVPDENGFAYAELHDLAAGLRIRMTATTHNVKGIQVFYPKKGTSVAIELVTHHPDPRKEVWGNADTGIRTLEPGESEEFGFRIDVFSTR